MSGVVSGVASAPARDERSSPFQGLVPYGEADADWFFGRREWTETIVDNLLAYRLSILYGASGVGKSSVLHAGVVRSLRARAASTFAATGLPELVVVPFAAWSSGDPVAALQEAVCDAVEATAPALARNPPTGRLADVFVEWGDRIGGPLLVVLDQFEDYFLYHTGEEGDDTFGTQFPLIVNEPNLRVHFIVSFREDAWASLDRFKGRIPELFANYVRIEHLNRVGGKDAIERPIEEYNNRLPPQAERYSVEPALVTAVLDAATAAPESANGVEPAGDEIETPFLQLVMERLWHATVDAGGHALTVKTLDDVGGARRIVETHLVNALDRLGPEEQEVAAEAFRYLVTRSRRRVVQSLSDLAEWLGRPEPEVGAVLEKLTSGESGRILRPVPPPPGRTDEGARYELFHDVLGEPILEWRRDFEAERQRAAEARRQRAVRRRLGAVALGLLGLAAVFGVLALVAVRENHRAQHERSNALASRAIRETALDPVSGLVLAMHAIDVWNGPQAQSALRGALNVPAAVLSVLRGHEDQVERASFSPDGTRLVTASDDGTARIWNPATGKARVLRTSAGAGGAVLAARFTTDGKHVLTGDENGTIRLWSTSGGLQWSRRVDTTLFGPELSADGTLVLARGGDGKVRVWSARERRAVSVLPQEAADRALTAAAFSRDDKRVLTANEDGTARIWSPSPARRLRVLHVPGGSVTAAAFSPDGKSVVLASDPGDVATVTNLATGATVPLRGHTGKILSAVFSNDGRYVLTAGDTTARLWEAATGRTVAVLGHHGVFLLDASFSPDGRRVVTAGADTTARVWDVHAVGGELVLSGHRDRVYDAAFSPDGSNVVTASRDDTARTWNARTGASEKTLHQGGDVLAVAYLPDGGGIATAGEAGVKLYGPHGVTNLSGIAAGDVDVRADGTIVFAGLDGRVRVGRPGYWRSLPAHAVTTAVFNPGSGEILTAGGEGVELWSATTLGLIRRLTYRPDILYSASFSSDGRRIATASSDGTARIFDLVSGAQQHVFPVGSVVTSARFSPDPDGRLLVTSSKDGAVRVWNTKSGALEEFFTDHTDVVWNASFSPDGTRVVSASSDGTAHVYRLTPIAKLITVARARLRATVTPALERAILSQP